MGRSMARGNEVDYFRVLAGHNDTQITVGPNAAPGTFSLDAGEYGDFVVNGHVHVQSNQAILVAQFLASRAEVEVQGPCSSADQCGDAYVCEPFSSSSAVDVCILKSCITDADCGDFYACNLDLWTPSNGQRCKAVGDPAMMLGVPMEQWQSNFVFLTPDSYLLDYINVVSAPGTSISLDGAALPESEFEAIGATGYRVYRSAVSDGVHTLEASAPVSVLVYGYDASVSYGYPGGLGLKSL